MKREGPGESGVDLNRNYGFQWGADEEGSSSNPCSDTYRGSAPFSEKETQTIRNLVVKSRKISSAVNFHAYGNLWIHPFSYASDTNSDHKIDPNVNSFYSRFRQELNNQGFKSVGTAKQTIRYLANGEASDWMLGEHGIVTLSPELGAKSGDSNGFFLAPAEVLKVMRDSDSAIATWFDFHLPLFEDIRVSSRQNLTARNPANHTATTEHAVKIRFRHAGIVDLRSLTLLISFETKEEALKLLRVEFATNETGGKLGLERDESLTKVRVKHKIQIPKLSENALTLVFSGVIEGPIGFQFFKLNKEIASISFNKDQIWSFFGRPWVQTSECRALIALLSVFFIGLVSLKIVEKLQRAKLPGDYHRPTEAMQI